MNIQNIIVIAILIEALITYCNDWFVKSDFQWKQLISLVIGIVVALAYQVDLPKAFGVTSVIPMFGQIISGIVFSRGSNYVFDLMKKLSKSSVEKIENDNFSEGRG